MILPRSDMAPTPRKLTSRSVKGWVRNSEMCLCNARTSECETLWTLSDPLSAVLFHSFLAPTSVTSHWVASKSLKLRPPTPTPLRHYEYNILHKIYNDGSWPKGQLAAKASQSKDQSQLLKGHMSLGSKMLYHQQNCNLLGARIAPMDNPSQSLARKGVLLSWSYSSIW